MPGFRSPRARLYGVVSRNACVYGPTEVREGSFIDEDVTLGYPHRSRLLKSLAEDGVSDDVLDKASVGCFIGPSCLVRRGCIIYDEVMVESNVEMGHNVLVRSGTVIRSGSRVGSNTQLDGAVIIGRNVNIQSNVYIPHLTKIMDDVFIGPNVVMTNDPYPVSSPLKGPTIGPRAIICAGCVILPGVEIGEGAVVGAGSVVTKTVKPDDVVYGVPAKRVYSREEYMRKKAVYDRGAAGVNA
jgi:acetyltransferase-like isoleucine patch superfamily enzyme